MIFEHDTPIKGHKIKYLSQNPAIGQLAERYFSRPVRKEDPNLKFNEVFSEHAQLRHEQDQQQQQRDISKNEDEESGVESDELNKSNEEGARKKENPVIATASNVGQNSDSDDSLVRLRKKQREMLEAKKYLNRRIVNDSSNTLKAIDDSERDATLMFSKEEEEEEHLDSRQITTSTNIPQTPVDKLKDPDLIRSSNSQKQLRTYILNLERKLIDLRNEMRENSLSNFEEGDKIKTNNGQTQLQTLQSKQLSVLAQRERANSNESCDSMKEVNISNTPVGSFYNYEVRLLFNHYFFYCVSLIIN